MHTNADKKENMKKTILAALAALLYAACATTGKAANTNGDAVPLDTAIEMAAQDIIDNLNPGTVVAVLNFASESEALSDYIIEEMAGMLLKGRKITVVDRQALESIRQEENFQMSGAVSDESAQAMGKKLGAQSIVTGSFTNMGDIYRFRARAINVETTAVETSLSLDVRTDRRVQRLAAGPKEQETENLLSAVKAANPGDYILLPSGKKYVLTRAEIAIAKGNFNYEDLSDVETKTRADGTKIKTISQAHAAYLYPDGQSTHVLKTSGSFTAFMQHIENVYFIANYIDSNGQRNEHKVIDPPKFDKFRASVQFQTLSNGIKEAEMLDITVYNYDGKNFNMIYMSGPNWWWGNVPKSSYKPIGESHQIEFDVK
jgi:TolB-like protein